MKKRRATIKEVQDKQKSDIPRNAIKLNQKIGRGAFGEVYPC